MLLLATLLLLLAGCSHYPKSGYHPGAGIRPALFSRTKYLLQVPDRTLRATVTAPPGWHIDPSACFDGRFIHSAHFGTQIVISPYTELRVTRKTTQAAFYTRKLRDLQRSEPERRAEQRRFLLAIPASIRPPAIVVRDTATYRHLSTVTLHDGRQIWIMRFHSPSSGYLLEAFIPEDRSVTQFLLSPFDSRTVPDRSLAAMKETVASYRCTDN